MWLYILALGGVGGAYVIKKRRDQAKKSAEAAMAHDQRYLGPPIKIEPPPTVNATVIDVPAGGELTPEQKATIADLETKGVIYSVRVAGAPSTEGATGIVPTYENLPGGGSVGTGSKFVDPVTKLTYPMDSIEATMFVEWDKAQRGGGAYNEQELAKADGSGRQMLTWPEYIALKRDGVRPSWAYPVTPPGPPPAGTTVPAFPPGVKPPPGAVSGFGRYSKRR